MRFHVNGRWVAVAVVALALFFVAASTTYAASKKVAQALQAAAIEQFGANDGPAYLMVSISSPTFDKPFIANLNGSVINSAHEMGSTLALIKTGYVTSAPTLPEVRFTGDSPITVDLGGAFIDGHAATFVGGVRTTGDGTLHVLTPTPDFINPIAPDVQAAYFWASRKFEEGLMKGQNGFSLSQGGLSAQPTIVELAVFIVLFGGEDGGAAAVDVNDVMDMIIGDMVMDCGSPCLGEGNLFGHQPDEDPLLFFRGLFDDDDDSLKLDIGRDIGFDIKPGNDTNPLNLGSEGVVPTAIYTEKLDGQIVFDAPGEIDVTTIRAIVFDEFGFELASIPVDKTAVQDIDLDGCDDLIVHFKTQLLVDLIDFEQTVTISFRCNTGAEGMELAGSDDIRIVPKN
jgi:hypothetical protein